MKTVVIIDYGMGNLLSVSRGIEHCGARAYLSHNPKDVDKAERVLLPGVGAFPDGMRELKNRGFSEALKTYATENRPLLGICLGMQMMMDASMEFGVSPGLGLIAGVVEPIPGTTADGRPHKIPHIGWNRLLPPAEEKKSWENSLLQGLTPGERVYFVHSYRVMPKHAENRLADCDYNGHRISAAIQKGRLVGCQFHPEKSGKVGLKIYKNFIEGL